MLRDLVFNPDVNWQKNHFIFQKIFRKKTKKGEPFILVNHPESKSFLSTALAWRGSVSPIVLPRVFWVALYSLGITFLGHWMPSLHVPITPFEYSGAVLALILVLRVNAGHERWWEARKIWGAIVNQSRNLALVLSAYGDKNDPIREKAIYWVASWPYVMKCSLRNHRNLAEIEQYIGPEALQETAQKAHMPTFFGLRIAEFLNQMKKNGMDSFAFLRAETERSQLIDAIGACERIRNTRMPFVLAIKTRRFILLFILLLPFALFDRAGWLTPLVVALAAYPLFSLDEIGAELQNPFSARNLSHLPLDEISKNIAKNVLQNL